MHLNDLVAILSIASLLSAAFNYVVIKPLRDAIEQNSSVLDKLKEELEASVADRRSLDARLTALEEAQRINKDRITHLETVWDKLKVK